MRTDYTVFYPDGSTFLGRADLPEIPEYTDLRPVLKNYLQDPEHVRVFHEGEYLDMFVDANSASLCPVNDAATAIYRHNVDVHEPNAVMERGTIHGPAVLFRRKVWF